ARCRAPRPRRQPPLPPMAPSRSRTRPTRRRPPTRLRPRMPRTPATAPPGSKRMTDTAATHDAFEAHHDHAHHDADHKPGFFARWLMSTNHKDIGTLYLIFAIVAGIIGGGISGLMRLELAEPGIQYLQAWASFIHASPQSFDESMHFWNVLVTAHGLIMVFF